MSVLRVAHEHAAGLVGRLTATQLADLAEGRGRLVFEPAMPATATRPARDAPARRVPARAPAGTTVAVDDAVAAIRGLSAPADVADYLQRHDRRLTTPLLKEIARALGPTVPATGRTKAELQRNIVEGTAGFRVRSDAMSDGAWSRP